MGYKGPVLRPRCIGPRRFQTQILFNSILFCVLKLTSELVFDSFTFIVPHYFLPYWLIVFFTHVPSLFLGTKYTESRSQWCLEVWQVGTKISVEPPVSIFRVFRYENGGSVILWNLITCVPGCYENGGSVILWNLITFVSGRYENGGNVILW